MKRRKLGELEVSAIGLGCMSMTPIYGQPDPAEAIATIQRAADLGIDFIDTSDAYAHGDNEELVAKAIAGRRDKYVIATKFGNLRLPDGTAAVDGRPDYVIKACDASLRRLGIDTIDLYFIHRVDPTVAIEETVGAMAKLVHQGKVRHLGISEAGPATIRRAHATHPLTAVQTEYSLWTRDVEGAILDLCQELGIGFVAYSPLGRGFLTGAVSGPDSLAASDRRRDMPRFQGENLQKNLDLLGSVAALAKTEGCTQAQLALAWILSRGKTIVPIAGTSRRRWLEENAAAAEITLSASTLAKLEEIFKPGVAVGTRYPAGMMSRLGL